VEKWLIFTHLKKIVQNKKINLLSFFLQAVCLAKDDRGQRPWNEKNLVVRPCWASGCGGSLQILRPFGKGLLAHIYILRSYSEVSLPSVKGVACFGLNFDCGKFRFELDIKCFSKTARKWWDYLTLEGFVIWCLLSRPYV
jgi:hypothetical protein